MNYASTVLVNSTTTTTTATTAVRCCVRCMLSPLAVVEDSGGKRKRTERQPHKQNQKLTRFQKLGPKLRKKPRTFFRTGPPVHHIHSGSPISASSLSPASRLTAALLLLPSLVPAKGEDDDDDDGDD